MRFLIRLKYFFVRADFVVISSTLMVPTSPGTTFLRSGIQCYRKDIHQTQRSSTRFFFVAHAYDEVKKDSVDTCARG